MRTTLPIAVFASLIALNVAAFPVTVVIQSTSATPLDTSRDGSSAFPSARYDPVVSSSADFPAVSLPKAPASSRGLDDLNQAPVLVRRDKIQEMKESKKYHQQRMDEDNGHIKDLKKALKKKPNADRQTELNSAIEHHNNMHARHKEIHEAYSGGIKDYNAAKALDKKAAKSKDEAKRRERNQKAEELRRNADAKIEGAKGKLDAYSETVVNPGGPPTPEYESRRPSQELPPDLTPPNSN